MKDLLSLIIAAILTMTSTGCDIPSTATAVNLMENITPSDTPIAALPAEKMTENNVAAAELGADLLRTSFDGKSNTLVSPLSVMSALAMTAGGANGDTLSEMEDVLGIKRDDLNAYMKLYTDSLPEGEKYSLKLANSIWFTEDEAFEVNEDFLQQNADFYGADIYKAPFDDSTLEDINNWVKDNTDGMIPEILDEIPKDAVMYLVNALAFDAEWESIYRDSQVREGEFTNIDGSKSKVDFMSSTENKYVEDENATGFIKYYSGREYAFVALLPDEGVAVGDYINSLTGEKLNSLITGAQNKKVLTKIPKFEYDYGTEMSETLMTLGMTDAFDENNADFKSLGTVEDGNIYISRVIHKTFISVAEKGTRAGAATVVEMTKATSAMPTEPPKEVYLDRPFVYMIIDTENNVPFFIGAVTNFE